jgi:hypothetical protein
MNIGVDDCLRPAAPPPVGETATIDPSVSALLPGADLCEVQFWLERLARRGEVARRDPARVLACPGAPWAIR